MSTRRLTPGEIRVLKGNGCRSAAWEQVEVERDFAPGPMVREATFSGEVRLRKFSRLIAAAEGIEIPAGIVGCRLHNVALGENCLVENVELVNVDVGREAVIRNVGVVSCRGPTSFANGVMADVLAERGGRGVPLWRRMSAPLAHVLCHCRGTEAAARLIEIIDADVRLLTGRRTVVGARARIERCDRLDSVHIGEAAEILGATELEECYVASSRGAPTRLGDGVGAQRTVFLRGAQVSGGVRLTHCLVGEGCVLERGFCAEHSLFFANCSFAKGEAASVMAGPFTASRHKATLALTCQCSFTTFGSAANASNNHFKIGPVHGGVLRRGVKMGSGSYLYWPADIGAFSTVTGRNLANLDTVAFPFSLVIGEGSATTLVPAVNIFGGGVFHDERKWRERENRAVPDPLDMFVPHVMSPYVMQFIDAGLALLDGAQPLAGLSVGGAGIPAHRVEPAKRLYRSAMTFHIGKRLLERAHEMNGGATPTPAELARVLSAVAETDADGQPGEWRDWGGLLVSAGEAKRFLDDAARGRISSSEALAERFSLIHAAYGECEWCWLAWRWRREWGDPSGDKARRFVEAWRDAVLFRHERFRADVAKEFSSVMRFGFGVERERRDDFRQSRGDMDSHPLVEAAEAEKNRCLEMARAVLEAG